ncbi:hypothetical protein [Xanthomonas citri]|uniref:hypothetical protein n=1 Tax=Xanthomonas citri TaxID=346 RepID=UPI000C186ED7|nr:hypothetical protein [Xanthomonas citri]ATS75070.1 hypothetical protein XcfCFBP6975P_04195 [Xanthomonas citri pv. phaseoli var. fuscans]
MTGLKELEKRLLKEVGALLKARGTTYRLVGQAFRLPKPYGWAALQLSFVEHPPLDFDVVVNIAIRVDEVQDIIQDKDDPLIRKADLERSATIGCELGNWQGSGQRRWTVATEADVASVAFSILAEFDSVALPLIEKYSDLHVLLSELKAGNEKAKLLSPFESKRLKTIAAMEQVIL